MVQKIPETLHDRSLHYRRQGGELFRIDLPPEVREDPGDSVNATRRLRIADQIQSGKCGR